MIGEAASNLYADARRMLKQIIAEQWLKARAVVGMFPANAVGDDVEVYADEQRAKVADDADVSCASRRASLQGQPHECLADYIAPKASGVADYIGAFAVTAGIGIEKHVARFERRTMTTRASCSRRWPTGLRKPAPSTSTSGCGGSSGAIRLGRR